VAFYFIPILHLFRPFQALSDAHRVNAHPNNWTAAPGSYLLGWWWFIHILAALVSDASARLTLATIRDESIDVLLSANVADTLANLARMPLNLLSIWVIWKLCYAQQEAHLQVVYSPPSPFVSETDTQPTPVETWVLPSSNMSGWAIAAGYAGLFAVLLFPAPIAFSLGIIAFGDCERRALVGRGRAIFAIIMGLVFTAIFLFVSVLFLLDI
jgi:hypothetical protein